MIDSDLVSYTITVNVPDGDVRTRTGVEGAIGESGLFEFEAVVPDKLEYYLYNNEVLTKNETISRSGSNPFQIDFTLSKDDDPSKVGFVFIAYDSTVGKSITYDYKTKILSGNAESVNVLEGFRYKNNVIDAYTGAYYLTDSNDKSKRSFSFTLTRPYAEIHVLCDDFMPESSDLYKRYSNGVYTYAGFGSEIITSSNALLQLDYPISIDLESNENRFFNYQNKLNYYKNTLTDSDNLSRITFKERKMDYLTCFYVLAPEKKNKLINKSDSTQYDYLNLVVVDAKYSKLDRTNDVKNVGNYSKYISIKLPEEGLQANTKYVIYNKSRTDGGQGWLDPVYDYTVTVVENPEWLETQMSEKGEDKALNPTI